MQIIQALDLNQCSDWTAQVALLRQKTAVIGQLNTSISRDTTNAYFIVCSLIPSQFFYS